MEVDKNVEKLSSDENEFTLFTHHKEEKEDKDKSNQAFRLVSVPLIRPTLFKFSFVFISSRYLIILCCISFDFLSILFLCINFCLETQKDFLVFIQLQHFSTAPNNNSWKNFSKFWKLFWRNVNFCHLKPLNFKLISFCWMIQKIYWFLDFCISISKSEKKPWKKKPLNRLVELTCKMYSIAIQSQLRFCLL